MKKKTIEQHALDAWKKICKKHWLNGFELKNGANYKQLIPFFKKAMRLKKRRRKHVGLGHYV